jgi:salicylate hydroxylase
VQGKDAAQGEVHRADFLDVLVKKLPDSYTHFDHRCTNYSPHANGVTLTFETTSDKPPKPAGTAECDVLIVSDGVKSALRAHLYERKGLKKEEQECRYSEWIAWRGVIPREKYEEVYGKEQSDKVRLSPPFLPASSFPPPSRCAFLPVLLSANLFTFLSV